MKLLTNKVHIQGMEVLLAEKVHKQEPQCKMAICFTQPSLYISSSGMADATLFYYNPYIFLTSARIVHYHSH